MVKVLVGAVVTLGMAAAGAGLVGAGLGGGPLGDDDEASARSETGGQVRTVPFVVAEQRVGAQEYWGASLAFLRCLEARGVTVSAAIPEPDGSSVGFGHTAPPTSHAFIVCSAALDPVAIRFGLERTEADEAALVEVRERMLACLETDGALPVKADGDERERVLDELSHHDPDRVAACYP